MRDNSLRRMENDLNFGYKLNRLSEVFEKAVER